MPSFPLACRSPRQLPDARFPVIAARNAPCPVVLTPEDGALRSIPMRSLTVNVQREGHVRGAAWLGRGAGDLLVTDSRVIVVGDRPTPDTLMAGHVLLDWIVAVGGCAEGSRFRDDALRVVIQLDTGEYRVLTFTFAAGVDVHEVAQDIARRTARSWLASQGSSPLVRRWHALAEAAKLTAEDGEFALHWTPSHTRVAAPLGQRVSAGASA